MIGCHSCQGNIDTLSDQCSDCIRRRRESIPDDFPAGGPFPTAAEARAMSSGEPLLPDTSSANTRWLVRNGILDAARNRLYQIKVRANDVFHANTIIANCNGPTTVFEIVVYVPDVEFARSLFTAASGYLVCSEKKILTVSWR